MRHSQRFSFAKPLAVSHWRRGVRRRGLFSFFLSSPPFFFPLLPFLSLFLPFFSLFLSLQSPAGKLEGFQTQKRQLRGILYTILQYIDYIQKGSQVRESINQQKEEVEVQFIDLVLYIYKERVSILCICILYPFYHPIQAFIGVSWSVYQYLYGYLQKLVDSVLSTLLQSLIVTYRHSYSDLSTLLQSLIDTHTFTHIHSYQLVEAIEYLNSISWNHFQSSCPFIIHSRKSINNYQMTIYYSIFNCRILSQKSLSNPIGLHSIDPLNPKIE